MLMIITMMTITKIQTHKQKKKNKLHNENYKKGILCENWKCSLWCVLRKWCLCYTNDGAVQQHNTILMCNENDGRIDKHKCYAQLESRELNFMMGNRSVRVRRFLCFSEQKRLFGGKIAMEWKGGKKWENETTAIWLTMYIIFQILNIQTFEHLNTYANITFALCCLSFLLYKIENGKCKLEQTQHFRSHIVN